MHHVHYDIVKELISSSYESSILRNSLAVIGCQALLMHEQPAIILAFHHALP